jgi:hypothetical protein
MSEEDVETAGLVGQWTPGEREDGHLGAEPVQDIQAGRHLRPHHRFLLLLPFATVSGPRLVLLLYPVRPFVRPSRLPFRPCPLPTEGTDGRTEASVSER